MLNEKEFITDNGNFIVDCSFKDISDPEELHTQINLIPGVVDNGIFIQMANTVIVGYNDGAIRAMERK